MTSSSLLYYIYCIFYEYIRQSCLDDVGRSETHSSVIPYIIPQYRHITLEDSTENNSTEKKSERVGGRCLCVLTLLEPSRIISKWLRCGEEWHHQYVQCLG